MKHFFEILFFSPRWYHYPVMVLLSPLSFVYGMVMWLRRVLTPKIEFNIPIVSVGNLIVGGSGKTPFVIALASKFEGVAIISRGYGRLSHGLVEVSRDGEILVEVEESGDEPMLMANALPDCSVIVSEDRHQAIKRAKQHGAKLIILDDGFNRVEIKKYDIVLEPAIVKNYLPFPAGAFREFWFSKRYADAVFKEGRDFERVVEIINPTERMILVTAISNPKRLDSYLPENVYAKMYLNDHAYFDRTVLLNYIKAHRATSLLCTSKDKVKLHTMGIPLSEMKLKLTVNNDIIIKIESYIKGYKREK